MPARISTTNSKLGIIPSINLPPIITCRTNCPCSKDCYARKGNYRFANVKKSLKQNLDSYFLAPDEYFDDIVKQIDGIIHYKFFRWHSSGDIVDKEYFNKVVSVANKVPQTSFLIFTKKFEIINDYIAEGKEIPKNLNIVFSAWGADFKVPNPHSFPVSYVRLGKDDKIPSAARECSGDCTTCLLCWAIQKGESVVFDKH